MGLSSSTQKDARYYNGKITSAWISMALFVLLTAVNIFSAATNGDTYYLFSAAIPYFLVVLAAEMCGMLPEEYYIENYGEIPEFLDSSFFGVMLGFAAAFILICAVITFFIARKKKVAVILGLVIAGVDTLATLALSFGVIDLLFHGWLIFDLASALIAFKRLPEAEAAEAAAAAREAAEEDATFPEYDGASTEEAEGDDGFSYFTDTASTDDSE